MDRQDDNVVGLCAAQEEAPARSTWAVRKAFGRHVDSEDEDQYVSGEVAGN